MAETKLSAEENITRITTELGRTKKDYPQLYRSMQECQDIEWLLFQLEKAHKVEQAAIKRTQDEMRHKMQVCEVCWTNSWVPVPDDDPDAQKLLNLKGSVRCDHCWLQKGYRQLKERIQAETRNYVLGIATKYGVTPVEGYRSLDGAVDDLIRLVKEKDSAALKEMLREARLEEASLRPHQDGCAALLTGASVGDCDDWCGQNKRISELEKARAGAGK